MGKHRGNPNKRSGSRCHHKRMSPKAAARRKRIWLYWRDRLARMKANRVIARNKQKECKG